MSQSELRCAAPLLPQALLNSGIFRSTHDGYPASGSGSCCQQKTSQPYASGDTVYWTTYTYDGIGRTLSVQQPDGASTTTYSYSGNQTTVTDPAGKWKTFTSDVLGNLTAVVEPDPSNPPSGTLTTTYTYDWMNHLATSTMTRGSTTQTRTFVYNDAGQLTSATNPENGTATYTYNTTGTLASKTDAKGQTAKYTYDSSNRITEQQWYPTGTGGAEDQCQRVTYTYGTDSTAANYGRLVTTAYGSFSGTNYDATGDYGTCVPGANATEYTETYTYVPAGGVSSKTLTVTRRGQDDDGDMVTGSASMVVNYTYNNAGQVATTTYPAWGFFSGPYYPPTPITFTYGYDGMGRPESLTDNSGGFDGSGTNNWVSSVTYDVAGRPTSMQRYLSTNSYDCLGDDETNDSVTESTGYNVNGQMTSRGFSSMQYICHTGVAQNNGITYSYSSTQNNGQITQATDTMSGETISYTYDSLKRLTEASSTPISGSTPTAWTQNYAYDGFGNMTSVKLNGVTTTSYTVDPATNRFTSSYDANGNSLSVMGATLTYDEANRVKSASPTSGGTAYYGYAPDNKRIYSAVPGYSSMLEGWTFFGAYGERLGDFRWLDWAGTGDCGYSGCASSRRSGMCGLPGADLPVRGARAGHWERGRVLRWGNGAGSGGDESGVWGAVLPVWPGDYRARRTPIKSSLRISGMGLRGWIMRISDIMRVPMADLIRRIGPGRAFPGLTLRVGTVIRTRVTTR